MDINLDLLQQFIIFFIKNSPGTSTNTETGNNFGNQQLVEELHKRIARKFRNQKYSENIYHLKTTFGVLIYQICN